VQANSQITALSGGNPNLSEETADTFTVGFVYQSEMESPFLEGLSFSVDYYDITIDDYIGIDAFNILYGCYAAPFLPAAPECASLTYSGPEIYAIYAFLQNLPEIHTAGVDFQLQWGFDLEKLNFGTDAGTLTFNYILSWLDEWSQVVAVGADRQFLEGTIGTSIGQVLPEWKWTLQATWEVDDFSLSARVNHIDDMQHRNERVAGPSAGTTGVNEYTTLDVFGEWYLTEHFTLRGGVLNATDEPPELYNPNTQAGTDPSTYDIVGRRYFAGVNVRY
jgi:outer membrane receptor protein involved in Fe transport